MLLQCFARRHAIAGPACQLVVFVYGGFNFLVSQSDTRRGTGSLQLLEELFGQPIILPIQSFACVERAEEVQATLAGFH